MTTNPFDTEWRECLRAHYTHVIRTGDKVTEPSLTVVLHQVGFTDAELAELRVRATLHVDSLPADFVPDLHALDVRPPDEPRSFPSVELPAPPVEDALPPDPPESVLTAEDQGEADAETEPPSADEAPDTEPPPPNPDAPQQLSFF
jgi:hypothetical protein